MPWILSIFSFLLRYHSLKSYLKGFLTKLIFHAFLAFAVKLVAITGCYWSAWVSFSDGCHFCPNWLKVLKFSQLTKKIVFHKKSKFFIWSLYDLCGGHILGCPKSGLSCDVSYKLNSIDKPPIVIISIWYFSPLGY